MQKIKVQAHLSIGYSGASHKEILEIEVEEDATDEQKEKIIDENVSEWANNFIDISWSVI